MDPSKVSLLSERILQLSAAHREPGRLFQCGWVLLSSWALLNYSFTVQLLAIFLNWGNRIWPQINLYIISGESDLGVRAIFSVKMEEGLAL